MTYTGKPLWYHSLLIKGLEVLADVLEEAEIPFWLDFGTLLGAWRNGKMIPWDYDTDIGIWDRDAEKLTALSDKIRSLGYQTQGDRNAQHLRVVRFFQKDFDFHVDIFPWFEENGKYKACVKPSIWREKSELQDFVDVEFEGRRYPCPVDPIPFFERFYGKDWQTPKVLSGNAVWIKKYDSENQDIINEINKHGGY